MLKRQSNNASNTSPESHLSWHCAAHCPFPCVSVPLRACPSVCSLVCMSVEARCLLQALFFLLPSKISFKGFNCEYASQRGHEHSYSGVIKPEALHPRWSWNYWQLDLGPLKKHAFSHFANSPAPPSFLRLACDCWDLPVSIVQCWDYRCLHQAQHQLVLWI